MSQPNSDEFFAHATPVSRIDSFATFRDSWSSLESGKGDETIRFSVTGQVCSHLLDYAFFNFIPYVATGDTNNIGEDWHILCASCGAS
jgi:hypothetical protein